MRWPWSKDVDAAQAEARAAVEEHAYAVDRRIETERKSTTETRVARVVRAELERNGYTELLQQAWGGVR
ncbi:hypothetical protein [Rhodococcus sp. USK13]|jgi:hypothetical protein|uniref:DUF7620 family protein n=1 Tax=Rhodococcus sp. USK13 TaxID=2806442 RepID=UPI001BD089D5|nr:hypothetical protein [Rhodococcus sp. USK13]